MCNVDADSVDAGDVDWVLAITVDGDDQNGRLYWSPCDGGRLRNRGRRVSSQVVDSQVLAEYTRHANE